ncbi:MAG TPA: jacalin-like lectin [Candidatus Angelobacter sp.]|nr:jacalin-like lectin [Candidatus Angelobacter sp.]
MAEPVSTQALGAVLIPSPVKIFQGYDSVTGRGLSTAVTGETQSVGGTSTSAYNVCTDLEKLSTSLEINQSLSIGFGPFGSFDEKMQFVYNLNVTTYSVSIVVHARHFGRKEVMTNVRLERGINPPKGNTELQNFFRSYGDSFLGSVTYGGDYDAVYTFYSETREEQIALTADMKANGIFEGGTLDASLQTKISNMTSSSKTRVSFSQRVSGLKNPDLPDSNHVIDYAIKFPSIPLDEPAIITFDTQGYEHVPDFGDFQPVAKNRDFFVGNGVVGGLTRPLVQIQQVENQITSIKTIYYAYGGYADVKLVSNGNQSDTDHKTINRMLEAFESNPTQTFTTPDLPSLKNGTPALNCQISHSQAYGGAGGGPFDDVDAAGFRSFVSQQTMIITVQLRSGSRIDKLLTTYQNTTGKTWTEQHGGNGGTLSGKLNLLPGQFIKNVSGRSGARVDHLTITAVSGEKIDGGGGGGSAFNWTVPAGTFMLGFSGRSGNELDQIQFVFGKFDPATWTPLKLN